MSKADKFLENAWAKIFYGATSHYRVTNQQMLEDQREHLRYSGVSCATAAALMRACEKAWAEPSEPPSTPTYKTP